MCPQGREHGTVAFPLIEDANCCLESCKPGWWDPAPLQGFPLRLQRDFLLIEESVTPSLRLSLTQAM